MTRAGCDSSFVRALQGEGEEKNCWWQKNKQQTLENISKYFQWGYYLNVCFSSFFLCLLFLARSFSLSVSLFSIFPSVPHFSVYLSLSVSLSVSLFLALFFSLSVSHYSLSIYPLSSFLYLSFPFFHSCLSFYFFYISIYYCQSFCTIFSFPLCLSFIYIFYLLSITLTASLFPSSSLTLSL